MFQLVLYPYWYSPCYHFGSRQQGAQQVARPPLTLSSKARADLWGGVVFRPRDTACCTIWSYGPCEHWAVISAGATAPLHAGVTTPRGLTPPRARSAGPERDRTQSATTKRKRNNSRAQTTSSSMVVFHHYATSTARCLLSGGLVGPPWLPHVLC